MSLPNDMEVLASSLRVDESSIDFSLVRKPTPTIDKPTDVVIRMEATPINPSDLGVIFGAADRASARQGGPNVLTVPVPPELLESMRMTPYGTERTGDVIPGNEGSGVVVAAGSDPVAQALLGRVVAVFGNGGCYATYRKAKGGSNAVMPMPDGVTPQQAASSFVNPMTALGFVHSMRSEGHSALVQTAAASQLGQMLMRICMQDSIPLVNVVRKPEQEAILKAINPEAICVNQALPSFVDDLALAMKRTNATLAFDATGGGPLSSQILSAFEKAGQTRDGLQLYNYGMLDTSRSTMSRDQRKKASFWLLPGWQAKNRDTWAQHMLRVSNEITTTFATSYTAEVSMSQAVTLSALQVYGQQETGKKYLLNPQKTVAAKL
mmetsp:Transcript_123095/g.394142  ORF Transcript_123095/g.394142 Transcript_123095/m.394142 type:complete len:379 (+) Transcript_123095:117-1253(+)|eukprot:CAMPEP_0204150686 /NCGR_PEP_ID=MMETSP0361-20130328/25503_1 /ASSEMBLY_ACC=CAM_ASM_000343 /TAXON_ID=268821 /ORGANISM="Scrippsiella Hangoei, Strain SHTV-5" /LENGTH=378 /DNA_ID=CAMNT_0051105397 /DNA_START=72 /DNA_END=1208 /DNA_ORIENTATION=-